MISLWDDKLVLGKCFAEYLEEEKLMDSLTQLSLGAAVAEAALLEKKIKPKGDLMGGHFRYSP